MKYFLKVYFLSVALAMVFCLAVSGAFAQIAADSTQAGYGALGILGKIPKWIPIAILSAYELIVRLVPTVKNYSILSFVIGLITTLVPNKQIVHTVGSTVPTIAAFKH